MSWIQYGVFLIPPPDLTVSLSLAHQVLAAEYNTRVAGAFMVHCTIKGFFKPADGVAPSDFTSLLDDVFRTTPPFEVEIQPPWFSATGRGSGESAALMLQGPDELVKLHLAVWGVLSRFVAADCPFTGNERAGTAFRPHLTLAQYDLPSLPGVFEQAQALCRHFYDTLPTHSFVARDLQLIEFQSDDWLGAWWQTMRYRHVCGWQLGT